MYIQFGAPSVGDLEAQYEKVEKYRERFFSIVAQCESVIEMNKEQINSRKPNALRLPKVAIPDFDGDVIK